MAESLDPVLLSDMDAYWRAANYLSAGQMYLLANPLLREPLKPEHVKPRVSGDWSATPVENFIYVHLNRVIKEYGLNMVYITGSGRSRQALLANAYLEGTCTERCPDITQDEAGLRRLFGQFSVHQNISSETAAKPAPHDQEGKLNHPLCRAYRIGYGRPELLIACVIGDSEAEARSLSIAWNANEMINPEIDGAVLPMLHLSGDEITDFATLTRSERERLRDFLHGNGHHPRFIEGDDLTKMHALMAHSLDEAILEIGHIQSTARSTRLRRPPPWPVLVVCTPSGWTGSKRTQGQSVEGVFRAQQAPVPAAPSNPAQLATLEAWLRSYRPEELFDRQGKLHPDLADLAPRGGRRMSTSSLAIDGGVLRDGL